METGVATTGSPPYPGEFTEAPPALGVATSKEDIAAE